MNKMFIFGIVSLSGESGFLNVVGCSLHVTQRHKLLNQCRDSEYLSVTYLMLDAFEGDAQRL